MGLPIRVGDRQFKLHFHHLNNEGFARSETKACMEEIDVPGEPPICWTGVATLHPNDRYVRETGRKVALANCLSGMALSRAEREEVWLQYFERKSK